MKNFLKNYNTEILSKAEMKSLIGGSDCCTGQTRSSCNGVCGGNSSGTCSWSDEQRNSAGEVILEAACICNYAPNGGGNQ